MKQTQTLTSGLIIRQDFADAVRPILFQTEYEDWLYATDGGTLFLVSFCGRPYALTCRHVFKNFDPNKIFVVPRKVAQKGDLPAPVKTYLYPSSPRDAAVGTDIEDVCVIEFEDDIAPKFFGGSEYVIDANTVTTSKVGHHLSVAGVLKDPTTILAPDISMAYCTLDFVDVGASNFDPFLRQAKAEFLAPKFKTITGLSGSPVFDLTENALCGMVLRGGMQGNRCAVHFIDISDIVRLLEGINRRAASTYYVKHIDPFGVAR